MPAKPSGAVPAALLIGLLLAALPARAGDRATLRVTARVVETCEIRVPDWVWEHVLKDRAKKAIRHRCRGRVPPRIDFDWPWPPPWARWRDDHRGPWHERDDRDDHHRGPRHDRDDHRGPRHAWHDRDDHRGPRHDRDHDRGSRPDRHDHRGSRTVWVTITY